MSIGIYKLNFEGTSKVYIGKSLVLENRFAVHTSKLRTGTHTEKMNIAYKLYGMPAFEVLCECTEDALHAIEEEAIEIFNAVENGFNTLYISGSNPSMSGESNPSSIHSDTQVIEAFNLLVEGKSLTQVSSITGVSYDTVGNISCCRKHLWLEKLYPEKYATLRSLKGTRISGRTALSRGIEYPLIISPDGTVHNIENIRAFSREHGLDQSALGKLLTYKVGIHKGWVRYEDIKIET